MKTPRITLSLTLIILAFLTGSFTLVHSIPSGQTTAIEGGGFCSGDFTIFNNTVDNLLYAEQCSTGLNTVGASNDLGSLFNTVRASLTHGGTISMRSGFYAVVTTLIFGVCANTGNGGQGLCETNIVLDGAGMGGFSAIANGAILNGTVLVAKTNGMTMIKATSASASVTCSNSGCVGAPTIRGNTIEQIGLNANGLASVGIDFRMAETATLNRFESVMFTGSQFFGNSAKFTTAMLLDGNEDSQCVRCVFNGDGLGSDGSATLDLQWQTPLGNIEITDSFFGGVLSLAFWTQQMGISESTISSMKVLGTCTACGSIIAVFESYLANQQGTGLIQLNGQTINVIRLTGDTITINSAIPLFAGTGTVFNSVWGNNVWAFLANSNWNAGGATLTHQVSDLGNNARIASGPGPNGAPTNFPFSIAGAGASGNF